MSVTLKPDQKLCSTLLPQRLHRVSGCPDFLIIPYSLSSLPLVKWRMGIVVRESNMNEIKRLERELYECALAVEQDEQLNAELAE